MLIGMLKVIQLNLYDLIDPGAAFSFVLSYVGMRFEFILDALLEPYYVSTDESIGVKRIYRECLIPLSH